MSGGVKGPNGPVYTPNATQENDAPHSSPVINPKPQIPNAPNQAPKSILKKRSVRQTTVKPQINKKAREKMELENQRQNLVSQLKYLLTLKQFLDHKDALMDAIADPDALPDDFTIVYIDENGQEVTVIPPDPELKKNPAHETRLRNTLKTRTYELDEIFNDESVSNINKAILTTTELFDEHSVLLLGRGVELQPIPDAPQRISLDAEYLVAPPESVPLPAEDTFMLDEKPVVRTPKKLLFDEEQFSKQWEDFYSSPFKKIPGQFHTLEEIRHFSDDQLEHTHDFIQLLFPNKHISEVNPGAPRLTNELTRTIHEKPALKHTALESVDQMLQFWGLERQGNTVIVNPAETERHNKWDAQFDHNHLRITRMLDFLMECGLVRLASNIEQTLQSQRIDKGQPENTYWTKAVGRQSGAARVPVTKPTPTSAPVSSPRSAPKIHHYNDYVNAYPYDECQGRDRIDFYYPNQPGFIFTNFYQPDAPIEIDNELWPTTEHYYQACKFKRGSPEWKKIQSLPDPDAVIKFISPNGVHIQTGSKPEEWDAQKDSVMMTALRAKARKVPEFRQALLDSGSTLLFETSPSNSYWGTARDGSGKVGKNMLGAMLMQIRDEINAGRL